MVTPGSIVTLPPIQTLSPMTMGAHFSSPVLRSAASRGWMACTYRSGTDKAVRAEAYRRAVHEIRAVIYKAVVADEAVEAVIDNEGREYADIPAHVRQQLAQYALALSGIRRSVRPS